MYKKLFQNKKGIILDLDGTIIHSRKAWVTAFLEVFDTKVKEYTIDPKKFIDKGETTIKKWKVLKHLYSIKKLKVKEAAKESEDKFMEIVKKEGMATVDGFWEFAAELKEIRGFKMGLATNSTRRVTDFLLDILGMTSVFDYTICGDEVRKTKPHPMMYNKLVRKMDFKKKEVLVIEDSIPGAKAAIRAGLDTGIIWDMKTEKYKFPRKVQYYVSSFEDFMGLMNKNSQELLLEGIQQATQNT